MRSEKGERHVQIGVKRYVFTDESVHAILEAIKDAVESRIVIVRRPRPEDPQDG